MPTTADMDKNDPDDSIRLVKFTINGLYDEFNYDIPLNMKDHVTAIIAPNGSGKTLCLRFIHALFCKDWILFEKTDFRDITFTFSNNIQIVIKKYSQKKLALIEITQMDSSDCDDIDSLITINFMDNTGCDPTSWKIQPITRLPRSAIGSAIDKYLPHLSRVGVNLWTDRKRKGSYYNYKEVIEQFSFFLPNAIRSQFFSDPPEKLSDFLSKIDCTLIETQRLFILNGGDEDRFHSREIQKTPYAISQKATKLKEIIYQATNRYAALSQSLDRTFPSRVISSASPQNLESNEIKKQLTALDEKREKLMEVGILDSDQEVAVNLQRKRLDPAVAAVLSVYIDDNQEKLNSLDHLYKRIALFKKLVDVRLGHKDVKINKEKGLSVFSKEKEIPIESLSSGEQHQLVLFFELLFETKENSLILIDEPEISLHIAWQKKFITDLKRIIELNKFDIVLATHSPQLIGKWSDLVVELGSNFDSSNMPDSVGYTK